jgi:hypothetical protein
MANSKAKDSSNEVSDQKSEVHAHHHSTVAPGRNWTNILLGIVIVLLVLVIAGGMHRHHSMPDRGFQTRTFGPVGMGGGEHGFSVRTGGGAGIADSQAHLMGVVTAVNGDTFTVAGSGSTTDVKTSSSTQYRNGSAVKVNDSVLVAGSISGGTFQASEVVVNP